jgi:hypothetical protein
VTIDKVRRIAMSLPRTTEHVVRSQVKFRVGRIVSLTPLFQSDSRVLGWLRDLVFPMSRWFPPLRRRMVRTMAGLDRGIVRSAISLDDLRRLALPARVVAAASG